TREAHHRLYDHLKQSASERPDTLQDMMPLYHAIAHGCQAGLHQEALDQIYYDRIKRGDESFSLHKLGAMGTDLSALSSFFASPWSKLLGNLPTYDQGIVIGETAYCLGELGRLAEAKQPMHRALEIWIENKLWENAARQTRNLSELYLMLGNISAAVRVAEQSVELADRSDDVFERLTNRTKIADALHRSAHGDESLVAFREAEAIQKEQYPHYPLLCSLRGFLYCDLLLDTGQSAAISNVRNRAEKMFEWRVSSDSLLVIGLEHLTLGRTYLLEALLKAGIPSRSACANGSSEMELAEHHLNESLSFLRQAGHQGYLPCGLLARAAFARVQERFDDAEHDLAEAEAIAERGSMLLWQIDAAIERCRLHVAQGDRKAARESLERAKQLIQQTEKPYQPHEPDWPDWEPPSYVNIFKPGEIVGYHRRNPDIDELEAALF
ncbi:MAG: hypothetical protein OEU26_25000, partial [Candidatus Tectomicrobia bacterium]|nr:hypothetical protein [Candidatus Tectomicrobia bacterium]